MSSVGDNIKALRTAAKISQNALAKKAGIAQATLSAIERQTKNPSVDTIQLLAAALGCSVSDLMDPAQTKNAPEIPQDPQRASIIRDYDRMSPDQQRMVRRMMDALLED